MSSWNTWISVNVGQIFLGIPAAPAVATSRYIPPEALKTQVLPQIKTSTKYGGVILWSRFYDNGYNDSIKGSIYGI